MKCSDCKHLIDGVCKATDVGRIDDPDEEFVKCDFFETIKK